MKNNECRIRVPDIPEDISGVPQRQGREYLDDMARDMDDMASKYEEVLKSMESIRNEDPTTLDPEEIKRSIATLDSFRDHIKEQLETVSTFPGCLGVPAGIVDLENFMQNRIKQREK